jgi:transposase
VKARFVAAYKSWNSRSKKTKRASEADAVGRAEFQAIQEYLPIEALFFLDEFGSHLAMTRTRARAPQGARAEMEEPFERSTNYSTIAALIVRGVPAPFTLEGAFDQEVFEAWVEQMLVPELRAGAWVLLDNVSFHYSARAIRLIEEAGAGVLHIPPYSPDFNPIEECFSKIKTSLRSAKARTKRKLYLALAKALEKVTARSSARSRWPVCKRRC